MLDAGGSEFPRHLKQAENRRDYFAAKAMQGWMATYPSDQAFAGVSADEVARLAYRIADAMLKARSL